MTRTPRTQPSKTATARTKTVRRPRRKVTASKAVAPSVEPVVERAASPSRAASSGQANGTTRPVATERKQTQSFEPPRAKAAPVVVTGGQAATAGSASAVGEAVGATRTTPEAAPRETASRKTSPLVAAFGDSPSTASPPERSTRPDVTSLPTTIMQVGRTQVEQSLALGRTILGARTVQDLMALQIKCIEQTMNHALTWARLSTEIMRDGMVPPTRR